MKKRLVVKIGTSTLTHATGLLHLRRIEQMARVLCDLRNSGMETVLVSSGAVGVGMSTLGMTSRPKEMRMKQVTSAVGQAELMNIYSKLFGEYGATAAQLLLTRYVMENEPWRSNARETMEALLSLGVIPIVNENDAISAEQLEFGDNDTLSAYVAALIGADMLVILSDIDGLYDSDPHQNPNAKLIREISEINDEVRHLAGGAGKAGTGGMVTKLQAAEIAGAAGATTVIANGQEPSILYDIIRGDARCTVFAPNM